MSVAKRYEIDMCNGPLAGKILRFALPFLAANLLQLLFNAADIVVVGKFAGDTSQAAVTSTTSLINLVVNLFIGLGVGVNVMVARALGSGDRSRISTVVHTAVLTAMICGTVMAGVAGALAPVLLRLMDSPENVIGLSVLYLRIYFLAMPADLVYSFGSALLRAQGDTRRPMYYLTLAGVVNVVLNLVFVIGMHWDVAGVAAATAISKYLSALLVIRCLQHETGVLHLDLSSLRIDRSALKDIIRIGLPAGLQSAMFALSNVTIQSAVNSMGEVVMAGSGAAGNLSTIMHTPTAAFYQAAMTFSSQNLGACKPERVDKVYRNCVLLAMLCSLTLGACSYVAGPQLLSIYTNSPEVIQEGMTRMVVCNSMIVLCAFMDIPAGVLRGLGYAILPLVITMTGSCFLRVVWVATVFPQYRTPVSLYISYPISWLATGIVLTVCYFVVRPRFFAKARAAKEQQA